MSWDDVSNILSKNKKIPFLKEAKETHSISKFLQKNWNEIFGKLATDITFSHVYRNILVVETTNPLWISEIKFYKIQIQKKIKDLNKKIKIYDIRIYLKGKVPEQSKQDQTVKGKTLEEKIKLENKRRQENNFHQCPTCKMWWEPDKVCLFCTAST